MPGIKTGTTRSSLRGGSSSRGFVFDSDSDDSSDDDDDEAEEDEDDGDAGDSKIWKDRDRSVDYRVNCSNHGFARSKSSMSTNLNCEEVVRKRFEEKGMRLLGDEPRWRESVRQQMETELSRRVREALDTPPLERIQKRNDQARIQHESPDVNSHLLLDLSEREREFLRAKRRTALQSRKLNERADTPLLVGRSAADGLGLDPRFMNGHALNGLNGGFGKRNSPCGVKMQFLFRDQLSRSNQDEYPGVFGLSNLSEGIKNIREDYSVSVSRYPGAKPKVRHFYTKEGFMKALRNGNLPSGVQFLDECGTYIDKYGVVRNGDGPFWPVECVPMFSTPRFKWWTSLEMEPLYYHLPDVSRTIDTQVTPYKGRWRGMQVTYDSERSPRDFSTLAVPEGCCPSLMFESRFECGNLRQARRIAQFEYELVLKSDLYTARHTQWYYFRVTNAVPGVTYKLRIVNLLKRDSLYNHGMRPLVYSEKDALEKQRGWARTGHHISYSRNMTNHNSPLLQRGVTYHMLEWQMEFPNADDTYYLAHCYPYSFTDLKEDLEVLMNSEERSRVTEREVMCETRAGNSCFLLTVTNFDIKEGKKAVVITARVHPGESQASWMMKGLLEFITGPDTEAKELRDRFIFKIVPMINPDGVIVGNYRCSLAARDLNRNYRHPRRESFPTIWYLKNMMDDLARKYEISLYCDLHGHSRKPNVFMYGNNTSSEGDPSAIGMARAFISERLFPWLMAARSPDKFCFKSCKFNIRRCKESTGRVVMWRQMGVFNSFTLETTFSGTVIDEDHCRHFNILDLMQTGKNLAQAVLDYDNVQANQTEQTQVVLDLTRVITEQILVSKGLIDKNCTLPDFSVDKETMETDAAKVQESAERWTGALLELLNSKPVAVTPAADRGKPVEDGKVDTTRTEEDPAARPVYTRDDVVSMLGKLTGKDARNMEDCLGVLAQMDVHDNFEESDSSDSDSESEPEMKPPEPKVRKKKRKSKKQRDHDKKSTGGHDKKHQDEGRVKAMSKRPKRHRSLPEIGQTLSALPTVGASYRTGGSNSANSVNSLPANSGKQATSDKYRANGSTNSKQVGGYISKYEGRHNGGVPCFTEERSMERAAKRLAELRKKSEDDRNSRELTFYCVDDSGLHPFSQDELRLKLEALADASGASPTHLMGLNVRTGYTHADNLRDLTPPPQQPLNHVNSFVLSTLNNNHHHPHHHPHHPHHHHHHRYSSNNLPFSDIQDHSTSDDSESEENGDDNDNAIDNAIDSAKVATYTTTAATTKTTNSTSSKTKNNSRYSNHNSSSNNTSASSSNHDASRTANYGRKTPTVTLGGNALASLNGHSVAIISSTTTTTAATTVTTSSNQYVGYALPVTARRNPYHHLDPLEQRPGTSLTATPRHHPNKQQQRRPNFHSNSNSYSRHKNHHRHPALPSNPLPPSSKNTVAVTMTTNSVSTPLVATSGSGIASTPSKKVFGSDANNNSNNNNNNSKNNNYNINNNSVGYIISKRNELKRESSNVHSHLKELRNMKRANTTLAGKGSNPALIPGAPGANITHSFSTHGMVNKSDSFVHYDVLTGGKEAPKTAQKPIQNVGQLVQQLTESLTGVISPLPVSKRFVSHNRNSPFRSMAKITPHSLSPTPSPLLASTLTPANRSALPDHMTSHRVNDKTRLLGLGGKASTVIRSLHSPRHDFSWE